MTKKSCFFLNTKNNNLQFIIRKYNKVKIGQSNLRKTCYSFLIMYFAKQNELLYIYIYSFETRPTQD